MKKLETRHKKLLNNKRKSSSKGFSILEMLLAMVIMLLATQLVAGAMDLAAKRYVESTNRSKAQMILSTLSDFVRSELVTASDVVLGDDGSFSFIDGSGRLGGRCTLKSEQNSVCLKKIKSQNGDRKDTYFPIVGAGNGIAYKYADNLKVNFNLTPPSGEGDDTCTYSIEVVDKKGQVLASGKYEVKIRMEEMD